MRVLCFAVAALFFAGTAFAADPVVRNGAQLPQSTIAKLKKKTILKNKPLSSCYRNCPNGWSPSCDYNGFCDARGCFSTCVCFCQPN